MLNPNQTTQCDPSQRETVLPYHLYDIGNKKTRQLLLFCFSCFSASCNWNNSLFYIVWLPRSICFYIVWLPCSICSPFNFTAGIIFCFGIVWSVSSSICEQLPAKQASSAGRNGCTETPLYSRLMYPFLSQSATVASLQVCCELDLLVRGFPLACWLKQLCNFTQAVFCKLCKKQHKRNMNWIIARSTRSDPVTSTILGVMINVPCSCSEHPTEQKWSVSLCVCY